MNLIDRLKQYNAWRRGETDDPQPHPKHQTPSPPTPKPRSKMMSDQKDNPFFKMGQAMFYADESNALLKARIAELEAKFAPPPEGFPSWEDWLASHGVTLIYDPCPDGWQVNTDDGWLRDSSRRAKQYPDYPTALAAAMKEAQDAE